MAEEIEIDFTLITNQDVEPCPHCGGTTRHYGYGFAAGGLGAYEICLDCDKTLSVDPDTEPDPERNVGVSKASSDIPKPDLNDV